ncbi:dihydrolipoyl dehydrogenase [Pseudomonadota bacterium]
MMDRYDVVVIGGGPGGYVAAIRCAQLGLETACIDGWTDTDNNPALGGTCLNVGCIPSKALLDTSHHYHRLQHEFADHGIKTKGASIDVKQMMARKDEVVKSLTGGVAALFAKNKVTWLQGHGKLLTEDQVEFTPHAKGRKKAKPETIEADNIIIATGSVPAAVDSLPVDGKRIVDSTGALEMDGVPKSLAVIGGGVIGLELGSVWSRLGADVSVMIRRDQFLPSVDKQLADLALKTLTAQGLNIRLGTKTKSAKATARSVTLTIEDAQGEREEKFDKVLVAAGRKPNTDALNPEGIGLELDSRGFIVVDDHCRTNLSGVYAVGDVVRGPMLAHKASEEGVAVAEHIAGNYSHVNYATIPWVIYTWPEIAWVGRTTQELNDSGVDYKVGSFPMMANGRARAMGDTEGLVKIIADAKDDTILGVHIMGPNASEMIAEAVVAMEFSASSEDLACTIHAHPTLSEAMHEAALAVDERSLHM